MTNYLYTTTVYKNKNILCFESFSILFFNRNKLCRFYGEYLLQSSTAFNLTEFLSIWQDSLPKIDNENEELFKVDLNQLEGLSLGKKHALRSMHSFALDTRVFET